MKINYLAAIGLINAIFSFLFGLFVLLKNRKAANNIAHFLLDFSITIFSVGYFFWQLANNSQSALLWFNILTVGIIFINVSFLHLSFSILGILKEKRNLLIVLYVVNIIFSFFGFNSLLYSNLIPKYSYGFWPVPTTLFIIYLIFWFLEAVYGMGLLFKGFLISAGRKKEMIRYFMISCFIGFIGGASNWPLWFNINFPPYLTILISIHVPLTAYAIIRHQFMDIEVLIKKSLVFAGMFVFFFGIFVSITLLVSQLFGGGRILSLAISSFIIIIGLRPIETFLVNATDKFLFQKEYGYKQILKKFIDNVITVLNLDEVVNSTLKLLDESFHPYAASIFILNKMEDKYQLYNAYGIEDKNIAFTSESKLVRFFKKTHNPAVIKQVEGIKGVDPLIALEMHSLKAVLVLPLLLHDDLIGFIALGRKKSDEDYTKDDLDVLLDLVRTESIAVGNAQLLTEAAQAERRAAIGTMAAGINHEIGNPLNIINTKIQLFITAAQRGFYEGKTKDEIMQECMSILDETIKQTNRIGDITRKLSNFAKPGKEFKPVIISVVQVIDDTLGVVGHDLQLDNIKIIKEISPQPNRIVADGREMEQILFNIIRNGGQAIEGSGAITIKVFTTPYGKVRIEIQDTGKGIPEDKIHRMFEPFFTTKGPSKGTGLGLSIVRQLVWKNKGEISFISKEGVGTTFILEFPKAKQESN